MSSKDSRDRGLTLPEVLIVVLLIGTITVVIAAAFSVVVRANPSNIDRDDNARSLLGLTNYLPLDVSSTPVNDADPDPANHVNNIVVPASFSAYDAPIGPPSGVSLPSGCQLGAGGSTISLLGLYWEQAGFTHAVNYRMLDDGGGWTIKRFYCTNGANSARNVSSVLVDHGADPRALVPKPVTVVAKDFRGPPTRPTKNGVEFVVTTPSGDVLRTDAASDNPVEPPLGDPSSVTSTTAVGDPNGVPVANDAQIAEVWANESELFGLEATDPDGDELLFRDVMEDPAGPAWPVEWDFTPTGQTVIVDVPPSATIGESHSLTYVADDQRGGTDTGRITFVVTDPLVTGPTTTTTIEPPPPPVVTPCTASIDNVDPGNVKRVDKHSVSPLESDVLVTIEFAGDCDDLVLVFDTDHTDGVVDLEELSFNDGTSVLILAGDFSWSKERHDLCVRNGGASAPDLDCADLNVT